MIHTCTCTNQCKTCGACCAGACPHRPGGGTIYTRTWNDEIRDRQRDYTEFMRDAFAEAMRIVRERELREAK